MSEKISVLIPAYNREKFLERAVYSILNQTYQNFEILIFDDGSIDNTRALIVGLVMRDDRIKAIWGDKNKGVGYARNQLLKACTTRYAIRQDSDDISKPERIEKQVTEIGRWKGRDMCYGVWENLKSGQPGTTRGFATLLFPVDKNILFPENMKFGGEDAMWRSEMEKVYSTKDVNEVIYSIDFHGDRIGSWKRKIDKEWGGRFDLKDIENLSYEEAIEKYRRETA